MPIESEPKIARTIVGLNVVENIVVTITEIYVSIIVIYLCIIERIISTIINYPISGIVIGLNVIYYAIVSIVGIYTIRVIVCLYSVDGNVVGGRETYSYTAYVVDLGIIDRAVVS